MRINKLIIIASVILLIFNNNIAIANPINEFDVSKYIICSCYYQERLGYSKEQIREEDKKYVDFFENKIFNYSKNYEILSGIEIYTEPLNVVARNISIFLDNKLVGYVMLKPLATKKETSFMNRILSYKLNNKSYFNKRIKDHKYTKLEIYEKKKDGYIERVFIANRNDTTNFRDINKILGETFYPEELDNEFKPEIIRSLNISMSRVDLETKVLKKEIKLKEYLKRVSKWAGNPNEGYKQPKRDNKNNIIEEPENDESYLKELEPSEEYLKNEAQYDSLED